MSPSTSQTEPQPPPADTLQEDSKTTPPRRTRPARNAANKARTQISEVALRENSPPEENTRDWLGDTLTPLNGSKHDDWMAWVEIESEPAFFNGLLRDLGVEDVRVVEMFSVSTEDVQLLPQPVLGFVFLCRYASEENKEDAPDSPNELWFANQTMANGCATVALLNILMNHSDVTIGQTLEAFKSQTADKAPILRGWLLDSNGPMRQIHNSYARCVELLNDDLLLSNDWDECDGSPDKRKAKRRKTTGSRKKKRDEDACHYKAFVHQAGQVWILDGLETNPVSLGEATEETWIPLALQGIADKMAVAGDMVNVLAVCQSSVVALRNELCVNVKTVSALRDSLPIEDQPPKAEGRIYGQDMDDDAGTRSKYGLPANWFEKTQPDEDVLASAPTVEEKKTTIRQLETEQTRIQSEFAQEMDVIAREEELCSGRKKDFSPVVHRWAKKLAERSALQGLVG